MFKPKFLPFYSQTLVTGYTKLGMVDINPFDGVGPSLGFIHLDFSFWFIKAKVAWELKK